MASNSIFAPLTKEEPGFQAVVNVKEKVEQVEDNFSKSKERGKWKGIEEWKNCTPTFSTKRHNLFIAGHRKGGVNGNYKPDIQSNNTARPSI